MNKEEHIYSIRKKLGITLKEISDYNIKSRNEIEKIDTIFSLKGKNKEKVLALLYLFASDENDDVIQTYRSATDLQEAIYDSTSAEITQYHIMLITALIFNLGFYAMAVNYYGAIDAGFPIGKIEEESVSETPTIKSSFFVILIKSPNYNYKIKIPHVSDNRGVNKGEAEDFNAMISDYTKIIEANPDDKDTRIMRGLAYYKIGEYVDALKDLQVVSEITQGMEGVFYAIANCYRQTGNTKKAIEVLEKIIVINPEFADVNELLEMYKKFEQFKKKEE